MFDFLKKALGAKRMEAEAPVRQASPIASLPGLCLGGTVQFDSLAFRVLQGELLFAPPAGDQRIEAYGLVDLGAGSQLHRFYLTDDAFVQVNTTGGVVEDLKAFIFAYTRTPPHREAFESDIQPHRAIGQRSFDFQSKVFNRVWGEDTVEAPALMMTENVWQLQKPAEIAYTVQHYCMLFEREIAGSERMEYLLVSGEDTDGEFAIVHSVGVDLGGADLQML